MDRYVFTVLYSKKCQISEDFYYFWGVMKYGERNLNFSALVADIHQVHHDLACHAARAVNISLTLRNWFIGCYISEYELHGEDRAKYGEGLLSELATELRGISNCNRRQLYRNLRFYRFYPQIVGTLSPQLKNKLPRSFSKEKVGTVSPAIASRR